MWFPRPRTGDRPQSFIYETSGDVGTRWLSRHAIYNAFPRESCRRINRQKSSPSTRVSAEVTFTTELPWAESKWNHLPAELLFIVNRVETRLPGVDGGECVTVVRHAGSGWLRDHGPVLWSISQTRYRGTDHLGRHTPGA